MHHTKSKGVIAETVVKLDLEKQGYIVFTTTCDYSPVDLIAMAATGDIQRIQVKYRNDHVIPYRTNWADKNGTHSVIIDKTKFDYFAMVSGDDYSQVYYVPSCMAGKTIRISEPKGTRPYYWWQDFKIGEIPKKRVSDTPAIRPYKERKASRKVERPEAEYLEKLVWEKPLTHIAEHFGVSDNAVRKWCKTFSISVPGRGFWSGRRLHVSPAKNNA